MIARLTGWHGSRAAASEISDCAEVYADSGGVRGYGRVECFDEYTNPYPGQFTAKTWVIDLTTLATVAQDSCKCDYQKVWSGSASAGILTDSHCYRNRTSGASSFFQQETGSAQACYTPPPPSSDRCESNTGVVYISDDCSGATPIVINLGHGDYRLTGLDDSVRFDIAATGTPIQIGWTAAGSNQAFLWMDRNGNGVVDGGGELFGNATSLNDGTRARNGFEALKELDANHDGVLDANDPVWAHLLLWRDFDHDGKSQPGEVERVQGSEITAIDVAYHWTGRRDSQGNTFRYQSTVWLRSRSEQVDRSTSRPIYDVTFVAER